MTVYKTTVEVQGTTEHHLQIQLLTSHMLYCWKIYGIEVLVECCNGRGTVLNKSGSTRGLFAPFFFYMVSLTGSSPALFLKGQLEAALLQLAKTHWLCCGTGVKEYLSKTWMHSMFIYSPNLGHDFKSWKPCSATSRLAPQWHRHTGKYCYMYQKGTTLLCLKEMKEEVP